MNTWFKKVANLYILQCILLVVMVVMFSFVSGKQAAVSSLAGGFIAIIPSILFAQKLFKYQGARSAKKIVSSVYTGEALKIILTALLFTIVFFLYKVSPLALFTTYIMVVLSHWCAPLLINKQ